MTGDPRTQRLRRGAFDRKFMINVMFATSNL